MEKRYRVLPRVRIEVVHDESGPFSNTPILGPADIFKMLGAEARSWDRERFLSVLNHPSGDPSPSSEDREITTRLKQAAEILGIPILDHVVLGHDRFHSFATCDADWKP